MIIKIDKSYFHFILFSIAKKFQFIKNMTIYSTEGSCTNHESFTCDDLNIVMENQSNTLRKPLWMILNILTVQKIHINRYYPIVYKQIVSLCQDVTRGISKYEWNRRINAVKRNVYLLAQEDCAFENCCSIANNL